ncbi:MAG: hypothetical protein GY850_46570 [bacterium]|nr:hypothetical protein [bacterium]
MKTGADVLIRLGEKPKAMEYVKRMAATERDEPYLLYGVACLYSLIGKPEEAVYYLTKSVEAGFAHRQYLEKDSDFDPIQIQSILSQSYLVSFLNCIFWILLTLEFILKIKAAQKGCTHEQ